MCMCMCICICICVYIYIYIYSSVSPGPESGQVQINLQKIKYAPTSQHILRRKKRSPPTGTSNRRGRASSNALRALVFDRSHPPP